MAHGHQILLPRPSTWYGGGMNNSWVTLFELKQVKISGHTKGPVCPIEADTVGNVIGVWKVASPEPGLLHWGHRLWLSGSLSHHCWVHLAGRGLTISSGVCDLEGQRAYGRLAFSLHPSFLKPGGGCVEMCLLYSGSHTVAEENGNHFYH